MKSRLLSAIVAKLSTMEGKYWPVLRDEDEGLDPDRASYAEVLIDLSDEVGERILPRLLTAFLQRPSHKALREWAVGLAAPPTFRIDAPKPPDAPRLTGPAMERLGGAVAVGSCPPAVKAEIARFRQSHEAKTAPVPEADAGEWGVVMRYGDGRPDQRCPARYSEAVARAKADANNAKYPHVRCSVWRRGETQPQPAGAQREAVTA